ncbi:non-ribosomal peptide synthetase, partial [Oceaniglobus roseus]|uniref:non-ribosomal peptide synthetase n=1 Tax=Oceaniglobus roseus TaxID=1737570 RepID=UPI0012FFE190
MSAAPTLLDVVLARAAEDGRTAFTFLQGDTRTCLSYRDLVDRACRLAGHIQASATTGERVLIALPPGESYVLAFLAAVLAGTVAVPIPAPTSAKALPRVERIAADAGAALVLTDRALSGRIADHGGPLARLPHLCVDDELGEAGWTRPAVTADDLLFLQYTSGSTGHPKGVMISHANAMANLAFCRSAFELSRDDVIVSWLPPHHDFGLVGGILSTVFCGAHAVHLTPLAFLTRPLRWLQAVHDFRATVTGAPNFAWDLCTRRIGAGDRAGLDLSSLRVAINGAERVRAETLESFATQFGPCGFDPGAFTPAYGLAEATLLVGAVTGRRRGELPATASPRPGAADALSADALIHGGPLVSNGSAPGVAIVGLDGMPVPDGRTGEIWVRGASVAAGYWGNPSASTQVFGLSVGGETGFMRTGDLGFLDDGALYVSGRSRELITLAGRNVFPQDIEPDVEALRPQFRAAGCAVVAQDHDGQTRLAVLQEVVALRDLDTEGLVESLRAMLIERHDIAELGSVVLLRTGDLPRTTSGKIQRFRCAEMLAQGAFSPVWTGEAAGQAVTRAFAAPRTPVERALTALWTELLEMEEVSIHDNFLELSGNSLLATQVVSALDKRFGVDISMRGLFENPTIAQLAQEIEGKLAERHLQEAARGADETAVPISDGQKRLFYLDQFAPGDPIYTLRRTLFVDGELRFDVLERAAVELSRRHEVLRYRFAVRDGAPAATLMPLRGVTVERAGAADATEAAARAQALADAPFDLMQGGLMRLGVVSQDEDTHLLVLALHAIVADEASADLALAELAALYSAYADGLASPLPDPGIQHADHVRWQAGWLRGALREGLRDWWRTELADAPAALSLPMDHPRPAIQSHRGARHAWSMPAGPDGAGFPDDAGAAFALLLHRFSGQEDLAFGIELPGRSRDNTGALVAPLANRAALRVAVSPGMTLGAVRSAYRKALDGAVAHGDLPFDQVLEAVDPQRRLDRSPLFQVMLRIESGPNAPPAFHGLRTAWHRQDVVRSEFDLTLRLRVRPQGVEAEIDYAADLFEPATIARMAGAYEHLLAAMAEPTRPVLSAPLMDEAETAVILRDWNATAEDFDTLAPIARMFEAQVRRRPGADCIVCGDEVLSFEALNRRANRLAHGLRARGVGPDTVVGLHVERSFEMMVALVGILKAGGAYLPLDPALPGDRLAYMARDAAVRLVLTTDALAPALPPLDCPVIRLDGDAAALPADESDPPATATLQNLAYVIYTSGSTGRPKGVAVPQGGVANRLLWMTRAYGVADGERVMQKTPYSFDVSVWELFWPLISGATLVMAKPGGHQDVAYLAGLIRDARITTIHFVPPMLEFFLGLADTSHLGSLRQVLCSGQALPVDLQDRFLAALPRVALRNLYGPTEVSIEVSAWDCRALPGQASVPIGHPIANTQLYILDAAMNPVPPGVAGELMLAGAGLARGYLNRPDLTAASFLPDPFGAPGARMYRSGDLARFRPDGAIEYLGRIDDQVKIRGFRIELGEIEARLRACPGIRDVLVVARSDLAADTRLVAYVVGEARQDALREALLATLPDYMVPAHFVALDRLPVTANGKVDRKSLPRPDMRRATEGFAAPAGPTQEALAGIWAGLLGLDRVGADDGFFALGGHSLLATQAISKIRERFGVDVSLRAILFDRPTIAELAPHVDDLVETRSGTSMTAIRTIPRDGPQRLSFSQERLWFLDQLEPGNPFYNIPAPTRLRGPLDRDAMGRALNEIVRRHDSLRTRFATADGPVQIVEPEFTLDIPVVDLTHLLPAAREDEARRRAIADAGTPFDLEKGPPVRATLLRLAEDDHVILFNMHHIISDGWSMGVLVTEFSAIYRAYAAGRDHDLPPLAIQYADFARWQRGWLQGETLQRQLSYWAEALRDAPPVLALPTDRPRPSAQSYRGATHDVVIPADLVAELYALGARHQSTLYMVLLSAFDVLLARYARERDICVGTYIANRNRAEIESLIGFFVNMLVLRADVDPEADFATLLRAVRHTALEGYANQDLPFEYLVDHLKPERSLAHSPLFQVVFVLQNTPMDDLDASGLATEPLAVDSHVSKFDLTLRLTEKDGQLGGCFEYATDLFDAATIAAVADQFLHLLGDIVRRPQARLRDLALLDPARMAEVAAVSDGRTAGAGEASGLLQGFAAQVARDPDHEAIGGLSYAALDARSTALARALVARGVRRGDVVGLWLGRGATLVTAML